MIVRWTDEDYIVLLDGEPVDSYHEANDEEGYIIRTKVRHTGRGPSPVFEGGRLATERVDGKVEIARKQ